jgi:hypothetical protein
MPMPDASNQRLLEALLTGRAMTDHEAGSITWRVWRRRNKS